MNAIRACVATVAILIASNAVAVEQRLDVPDVGSGPFALSILLDDGTPATIELAPHDVRTPGYQVLAVDAAGRATLHTPGPITTYRGHLRGDPAVTVAAAMLDDGLHATIERPIGAPLALAPSPTRPGWYSVREHVAPDEETSCLTVTPAQAKSGRGHVQIAAASGSPAVAELACDADYEYFLDHKSVEAVEARIHAIVNQVNVQYETQVGITHEITTIIVRIEPLYVSTDPETLLSEFRLQWLNEHGTIPRDLAHLFTGKNLNGNVIGAALTEGAVCTTNAYCIAQSDYNGIFGCATDLTAHELGHLWGASHCACPSFTMNPSITCANSFTTASRDAITTHRDSRTCLNSDPVELYCPASSASDDFEFITRVVVGSIDHMTGASFYSDFTTMSTTMPLNSICPIEVTLGGGYVGDIGALWIDWNDDDDFDDEGELVAPDWSGAGPYTASVVVPASAELGATRMRIRIQDGIADPDRDPCGFTDFGEVEDYVVIVVDDTLTGACCFGDGTCILVTADDCTLAGGAYEGDLSSCAAAECPTPCPEDFDGDGIVGFLDLLPLLSNWGPCPECPEDLDGDGVVTFLDLLAILSVWGPC